MGLPTNRSDWYSGLLQVAFRKDFRLTPVLFLRLNFVKFRWRHCACFFMADTASLSQLTRILSVIVRILDAYVKPLAQCCVKVPAVPLIPFLAQVPAHLFDFRKV
jgi:hypothetical protein